MRHRIIFYLTFLVIFASCGTKEEKKIASTENSEEKTAVSKKTIEEPSRDKMIADLYLLQRKLANYDIEDAKKFMATQYEYGDKAEKRKEEWANIYAMEKRIGTKAIDALAEYGSYGKLEDISPSWHRELQREKTKTTLYADNNYWYAMTYKDLCVTAYWNEVHFVFCVTKGLKDEKDDETEG
jgi:hypothetical protein